MTTRLNYIISIYGFSFLMYLSGTAMADVDEVVKPISEQEAITDDAKAISEKTGWTLEETVQHLQSQVKFGQIVSELAEKYPSSFSGAAFAETPGAMSTVYFKGKVPAVDLSNKVDTLTIQYKGGSKLSISDREKRMGLISSYLKSKGMNEYIIAARANGTLELTVGGSPVKGQILPFTLSDGVELSVTTGSLTRDEHTRGGAKVLDDGVFECTSGFTVISIFNNTTGVTTAGHCNGINQYMQPSDGLVYGLTHQAEHIGILGDVEWKTSPHIEPAEFFSSPSTARSVFSVEALNAFAENNWYCFFGRASNSLSCDRVYSTNVSAGDSENLVAMDNDNTIPGDSGGPWFVGSKAVGGHKGDKWIWFGWRNVFSKAVLFPSAIGVRVQTTTPPPQPTGWFQLRITKSGQGSGTVSSNPSGISCGSDCSEFYPPGTIVRLSQTPARNSLGGVFSGDPDCSDRVVTMNANKTCDVEFLLSF